jgi:hypothetical protein
MVKDKLDSWSNSSKGQQLPVYNAVISYGRISTLSYSSDFFFVSCFCPMQPHPTHPITALLAVLHLSPLSV